MKLECTLQCRWCAVCPSVFLLQTVDVRLTSSSSGMIWLWRRCGCVFLLSVGTWKVSSATEKRQIKFKQTSRCTTQALPLLWWMMSVYTVCVLQFNISNIFSLLYAQGAKIYDTSGFPYLIDTLPRNVKKFFQVHQMEYFLFQLDRKV